MKRFFLVLTAMALLGTFRPAQAQTEKGNLMLGTQVANIGATFQNHSNSFNFEVTPSAAYFIENNLALGAMLTLGLSTSENEGTTFSYGLGPWMRYYFATPEEFSFSSHTAFFIDGFVGFQGVSQSKGGGSTNGLGIRIGPGLSYFITPNISLDGALNYNLVLGFGDATTINRLGINVGFQIFLPAHGLREKYERGDL